MITLPNSSEELFLAPSKISENLTKEFAKNCYVKLPAFFNAETFAMLKEEAFNLLDQHSKRKDFVMKETESTHRHITTVSGKKITAHSTFIPTLYENQKMIDFLQNIANESMYLTPDSIDRHTVHRMHECGDIHGGHVDDYAFVLITCIEAPGPLQGGEIEFVPNSTNIKDLGTNQSIIDRLEVGDAYFMRSNKAVHRVLPLKEKTNRTVVVFTYADLSTKNIKISYSSNSLYD